MFDWYTQAVKPLINLLVGGRYTAELEAYHRRFVELVCVPGNRVNGCQQIEKLYPMLHGGRLVHCWEAHKPAVSVPRPGLRMSAVTCTSDGAVTSE